VLPANPLFVPAVVSSQVSHVPQGVMPPAQLTKVPLMLTNSLTTVGSASAGSMSTTIVVQPPPAVGS
jgi:hypothetical protein